MVNLQPTRALLGKQLLVLNKSKSFRGLSFSYGPGRLASLGQVTLNSTPMQVGLGDGCIVVVLVRRPTKVGLLKRPTLPLFFSREKNIKKRRLVEILGADATGRLRRLGSNLGARGPHCICHSYHDSMLGLC